MKTATFTDEEIISKAHEVLIQALGRGGFVRYLQAVVPKSGDYTAEKHAREDREAAERGLPEPADEV